MSPEANQEAGGIKSAAEAGVNKAPTQAEVDAKAAADAKVDESIVAAEQANSEAAAKRALAASDQTEGAEASAENPVAAPVEAVDPPHPAIAMLEGPASDLGHVIDITGVDYDALPCGPCVVDDHGRLWRVRSRKVDVVEEREGDEEPVTHTERHEELVLVGRVQR